jgi:hypothetical protein
MDRVLDVYQDGLRIGSLHDEQPLRFSYEADWLKSPDADNGHPGTEHTLIERLAEHASGGLVGCSECCATKIMWR